MAQAWFSRCLLHPSSLVRHTALQLLQVLLEAWQRTHAILVARNGKAPDLCALVGLTLRRRMPDVQTVVASHAVSAPNEEVCTMKQTLRRA